MAIQAVTQYKTSKGKMFATEAEAQTEEAKDEVIDLLKFAIREAVSNQDLEEEQVLDIANQILNQHRELAAKLTTYTNSLIK